MIYTPSEIQVANTIEVPEMEFLEADVDYAYARMEMMHFKYHKRVLMTYFPVERFLHYIFIDKELTDKEEDNYYEVLKPYVDTRIIRSGLVHLGMMRLINNTFAYGLSQSIMLNDETLHRMCFIVCLYQYLTKMSFLTFLEYEKYLVLTEIDLNKAIEFRETLTKVGQRLSELKLDYDSRQKKTR